MTESITAKEFIENTEALFNGQLPKPTILIQAAKFLEMIKSQDIQSLCLEWLSTKLMIGSLNGLEHITMHILKDLTKEQYGNYGTYKHCIQTVAPIYQIADLFLTIQKDLREKLINQSEKKENKNE